jgi:hypothetical protein
MFGERRKRKRVLPIVRFTAIILEGTAAALSLALVSSVDSLCISSMQITPLEYCTRSGVIVDSPHSAAEIEDKAFAEITKLASVKP